jgi:hypothetical protein
VNSLTLQVKAMNPKKIVYSINVEDLQTVADQELDRGLTDKEIKLVEERLANYIDWYGAISLALDEVTKGHLTNEK